MSLLPRLAVKILNVDVDPTSFNSVDTLLTGLLKLGLFVAGAVSVIFIIVGGIQYVASAGSPDAVRKAKTTIVFAIAGLVVAICATLIINFTISAVSG